MARDVDLADVADVADVADLRVDDEAVRTQPQLRKWVDIGVGRARSLRAKAGPAGDR